MALTLPTEQIETRQLTLAAAANLPKKKKGKNFPTKSDNPIFFSPAVAFFYSSSSSSSSSCQVLVSSPQRPVGHQ